MILYVSFVKVYCESFKHTYGALRKKGRNMVVRSLTKCRFLLIKWLCISLIMVLEMSHTQMLQVSQESPGEASSEKLEWQWLSCLLIVGIFKILYS